MVRQPTTAGRAQIQGAFVALAAACCFLLAPGTSHASCGDHVRYDSDQNKPEKHPPAAPCQGPNCSQAPAHAPLVPAPVTTHLDHDTALLPGLLVTADVGWRPHTSSERVHAVHCSFPPEPPPRVIS